IQSLERVIAEGTTNRNFKSFRMAQFKAKVGMMFVEERLGEGNQNCHTQPSQSVELALGSRLFAPQVTRKDARKPRPHAPPRNDGKGGDESQPLAQNSPSMSEISV
ncbi:MAG: hypothetical protein K1Y36_30445, partial [Blastocatellia bacterium]|nr:hypothetical protein [Blastocatellia bacterium]